MVMSDWTPRALQQLHHAVTQVDYRSLFAYYGYRVGFLNGGCWLIAKAIQQVAGGELQYVEVKVDAVYFGDFVHTVVKLGDDTFMNGRGLHTSAQLLSLWSHLEQNQQTRLSLQPLFFFPNVLERNLEVSAAIAWTITQQLLLVQAEADVAASESMRPIMRMTPLPTAAPPWAAGLAPVALEGQGDRPPRPVNETEGRVSHPTLLDLCPPVLDW